MPMKTVDVNKVSIIIESLDKENASVKLKLEPEIGDDEEYGETPAVVLGAAVWEVVQGYLEQTMGSMPTTGTLQ